MCLGKIWLPRCDNSGMFRRASAAIICASPRNRMENIMSLFRCMTRSKLGLSPAFWPMFAAILRCHAMRLCKDWLSDKRA